MNLLTNENWATQAKKYFTINDVVELNGNKYEIDYTLKDEFDNIIAYGYNFEREDLTEKEMYEEFHNPNSSGDNFTKAIFNENVHYHNLNPILFLVKKDIIYHTTIGIVHHLHPRFISTKDINSLLDLLINVKEDSERKIRLIILKKEEEENFITIQELKNKGVSIDQIKKITSKPLWFEKEEYIPLPKENENNQIRYNHFEITSSRLCVYFNNKKELVIKAGFLKSSQTYENGFEHSSNSYETKYWIVFNDGNTLEFEPSSNEKYQLLKL